MQSITYSHVDSLDIKLDLHLPPELAAGPVPALVHFHRGGMMAGSRKTLASQHWLKDATLDHSILFISADHRLLHPSTAFDIIADVKTLFAFLADPHFSRTHLPPGTTLDAHRIAVSGESGGGYAARAAGIYADPAPAAVLLQSAQGGQLLDDHSLAVKDRHVPDPWGGIVARESVAHLLDRPQEPICEDAMMMTSIVVGGGDDDEEVAAAGAAAAPPNNNDGGGSGRARLQRWWWRTGGFVDVLLGVNGMARFLRNLTLAQREGYIPEALRGAVLQTQLTGEFPATFLLHGGADRLVLPVESRLTYDRLRELGVEAELHLLEGAGHGMMDEGEDYPPRLAAGAREIQRLAVEFLVRRLKG